MSTVPTPLTTAATSLPAALRLGPVHLTVTDLDRSSDWYQHILGLRVHRHEAPVAELGDGATPVVVLVEDQQARRPGRHAGLYHYALLHPTREWPRFGEEDAPAFDTAFELDELLAAR